MKLRDYSVSLAVTILTYRIFLFENDVDYAKKM